jgi:hypothetical protein
MIKVQTRVSNEGGSFSGAVCAENLRRAGQTAKACYPLSTVSIAFPIEPEYYFANGPPNGEDASLEVPEEPGGTSGTIYY